MNQLTTLLHKLLTYLSLFLKVPIRYWNHFDTKVKTTIIYFAKDENVQLYLCFDTRLSNLLCDIFCFEAVIFLPRKKTFIFLTNMKYILYTYSYCTVPIYTPCTPLLNVCGFFSKSFSGFIFADFLTSERKMYQRMRVLRAVTRALRTDLVR